MGGSTLLAAAFVQFHFRAGRFRPSQMATTTIAPRASDPAIRHGCRGNREELRERPGAKGDVGPGRPLDRAVMVQQGPTGRRRLAGRPLRPPGACRESGRLHPLPRGPSRSSPGEGAHRGKRSLWRRPVRERSGLRRHLLQSALGESRALPARRLRVPRPRNGRRSHDQRSTQYRPGGCGSRHALLLLAGIRAGTRTERRTSRYRRAVGRTPRFPGPVTP